jgi:hypothetical protein
LRPFIPATRRLGPARRLAKMPPAEFNKVRDETRRRVIDFIEDLKKE